MRAVFFIISVSSLFSLLHPKPHPTLITYSVHGSDIPGRNRILSFGGGTSMVTTPYDPVSGILGSMSAVSGTQTVSRWIRSTPNGDIIIQPDFNVDTNPGRFQVDSILRRRLNSDGTFSEVNGEYTIGEPGGYYVDVLKHPNDRWFYIMGGNGVGNRPIIHLYTMNLESGSLLRYIHITSILL